MRAPFLALPLMVVLFAPGLAPSVRATSPDPADDYRVIDQFLAQHDALPAYRAVRRLEAENGDRHGWIEAITEYSPQSGFRYEVTAEGGSPYIRSRVLKAVLETERDAIANGESRRSALTLSNYSFQPQGIDDDGLAIVLLSPKRKERVLVSGVMALDSSDGALVRLQGRLAKSPSFWVKHVDIVRSYQRINGNSVPVALDTKAQMRFLGDATFRMTYVYFEIDGRPIPSET